MLCTLFASLAPAQERFGDIAAAPAVASLRPTILREALMPQAITSFGACRSGSWLYAFGGHIGRAHAHSRDNVVGSFRRMNLLDGSWQDLPDGPALQGTALVAGPDGSLYRIGGTDARNERGDASDMHSTDTVARFDPAIGKWQACTPLPEPRSSHDAVVLAGKLYVIGGWNLQGDEAGTWHQSAWVADLNEQPIHWRPLPTPGHVRRACSAAAFGGRIAVVGGMSDRGLLCSVAVYDPASEQWSTAPDLPGFAFGTAAIGCGEELYATIMEGTLLRWSGGEQWQPVAQLESPRIFHRLVLGQQPRTVLALGGAGRGAHMRTMETLSLDSIPTTAFREYSIPAPSRVAYRQALLLQDNTLWAFGGNRNFDGDRFDASQFADDVWRIDLNERSADLAGRLPTGCQSMAACVWGDGSKNLVIGGIGMGDEGAQSLAGGFAWNLRRNQLVSNPLSLPAPRTQLQLALHESKLYAIGGTDFRPNGDGAGTASMDTQQLLVADLSADKPKFVPAGIVMPEPRRSFGAVILGEDLFLIGGLGVGFAHSEHADVYNFKSQTWRKVATPTAWVSPQVVSIGKRIYVACGGTMKGQAFRQDRSLWCYQEQSGWQQLIGELPFAVRHMQMLASGNRLVFYTANEGECDRIVIRTFEPDPRAFVPQAVPSTH